jgi:NAD(P)-dependent dehydrogenase (short-subunit alcohol dehydrogenase family)
MIDYRGKAALVTGAASGIGRALAQVLKARGADVVLADVNAAGVKKSAGEIGGRAIVCDLARTGTPAELVEEAYAAHGRLDLVCSNAGIGRRRRILKENVDADVERLFAVNLFAGVRLAQAYAAKLGEGAQDNIRGRILFTASENSLSLPSMVRNSRLAFYAATKHALLIVAEWMAAEMGDTPLDVHVLMPGAVYTPLVASAIPDPANAPAALELIMPETCAAIALKGMDLGLFYIPTQAHLATDMLPRTKGIEEALKALGIAGGGRAMRQKKRDADYGRIRS